MEETVKKSSKYKLLLVMPIVVLIITSLGLVLIINDLNMEVDLKGGNQLIYETSSEPSASTLTSVLGEYDANVRIASSISGYTVFIDFDSETNPQDVMSLLRESGYDYELSSSQTIGPALGASFFYQAKLALVVAFIFMAIVVFIIFRAGMPSLYVVFAAGADIIETLLISQVLGIKLSLATFAALLLLIGYSVDTDILLTTRVLKRVHGTVSSRIRGSMKTGITMSVTTLAATSALFFISSSTVITQIASILIIGILLDMFNTWFGNAIMLRWWAEKREKK